MVVVWLFLLLVVVVVVGVVVVSRSSKDSASQMGSICPLRETRSTKICLQKQQKFVPEKLTAFPPVLKTPIESIEELQKALLQKSCTQKLQSRKPEKVLPEKWAELNFPLLCKPRFAQNRKSGESLSAEMDRISPLIINLKLQSRIAGKKAHLEKIDRISPWREPKLQSKSRKNHRTS